MEKVRVVVKIAGKEYSMVSTDSESHVKRTAAYVDRKMTEIQVASRQAMPALSVLVALNIADELLKAQEENRRLRKELASIRK